MPSAGTLSLSNFLNSAASSSASRKRPHAEITRSQSRSLTPDLPAKRRRLSSMSSPSSLFSGSPSPRPPSTRSERDGYDFRRPAMSTRLNRLSQGPDEGTIDLTGDDSDVSTVSDSSPRPPTRPSARSQSNDDDRTPRAPPFTQRRTHQDHEVIDLSDESDLEVDSLGAENDIEAVRSAHTLSSSPEVQFLGEQPAPPGNRRSDPPRPPRRNPSPRHMEGGGPFGYLPDLFRRGTQFMFGTVAHNTYDQMFTDRYGGGGMVDLRSDNAARANVDTQEITIQMDYRRPAFALGPLAMFDRSSETPQVVDEPYKAPPAPRDGFIRTFTEEEIVLCPRCGDELAVGKSETKQQVWVVKNCGHVYCGDCASQRAAKATPRKKPNSKVPQKLEKCVVEDCASKLTGKMAMFPIYL